MLAAVAAGFSADQWPIRLSTIALTVPLFWCAAMCIHAARPRDWTMVGYDPTVVMTDTLATELEALESIAAGLSAGIQDNNRRLDGMGKNLRLAGWLLVAAPFVGAAAYAITAAIMSAWG
jgi:hypothetical protein